MFNPTSLGTKASAGVELSIHQPSLMKFCNTNYAVTWAAAGTSTQTACGSKCPVQSIPSNMQFSKTLHLLIWINLLRHSAMGAQGTPLQILIQPITRQMQLCLWPVPTVISTSGLPLKAKRALHGKQQQNTGHITICGMNVYPLLVKQSTFSSPKIKINPSMKLQSRLKTKQKYLNHSHHESCLAAVGVLDASKPFL